MLKDFVRSCLKLTPYELRRRREERILPDATFENVRLALVSAMVLSEQPTLVQIGACDGTTGDPIYDIVRKGLMKAVLVEPLPAMFEKLGQAYQGVRNVVTVQAAVGHFDGTSTLYKAREGITSLDAHWAIQVASFDRKHLLKIGLKEHEIESVEVPCLTLQTLLSQNGLQQIDVLQIDTEGFDAEVVKMALGLKTPPGFINFENLHLDNDARKDVFARLKQADYRWTHDDWNTLAIHASVVESWGRM